ncbi:DUF3846 domain-containing protein [Kineococcus rhizosphaerae]|uniref:Uncharacterized protein DUF3846 n=1 Tax=Kineococcus rhizosphaerae TaxID=559628 RepID=A0A2T0QQ19_9ACTN|nr:DUF3846 domain-containing protein [Kineococcus rhizosphaerae]PRY06852.1 uncharacterized protein DUF3846 [Kineococcus rhizosphaerae]
MSRAILIPADTDAAVRIVETNGLHDLQRLLDGNIDYAPLNQPDLTLWINDEGKMLDLPRNERADAWWKANIRATFPGDYIAGDAVLVGFDRDSGEDTDVPARIITQLHPAPLRLSLVKH